MPPIHPAHLFKQVLCEHLGSFVPPQSPEAEPLFGAESGTPVLHDEDPEGDLKPTGPDILIYESAQSEEVHEGLGVWRLQIAVTLTMPGDTQSERFTAMEESLWQYLSGEYPGDVSGGGDEPGPLAGKLNAVSARLTAERPDEFPRLLCVGDVWQLRRAPPELDSAAARVVMFSLTAIAEVMPPGFAP